jgi:uncharacterized tellurite resistance protein B-like protein
MRKYPTNSRQAAARIIALTIVADGEVSREEYALLEQLAVQELPGLSPSSLNEVFDDFCEDLLSSRQLDWADDCPVDEYTLAQMMGEIDDPVLRRKVLGVCVRLAEVDGQVSPGESIVLVAAVEHWCLHHHMLQVPYARPSLAAAVCH